MQTGQVKGDYCKGRTFIGEIFTCQFLQNAVGYFLAVYEYDGYSNNEVCGGENDVVKIDITLVFYDGSKLVLKMKDKTHTNDILWGAYAAGEYSCTEENMEAITNCFPNPTSTIASIAFMELKKEKGCTQEFDEYERAYFGGILCQNDPNLSRILGWLILE